MKKILLWGTGKRAQRFMKNEYFSQCKIIGFIDSYKSGSFFEYPIFDKEWLLDNYQAADYIIITVIDWEEIFGWIMSNRIDLYKVICTQFIDAPYFIYGREILKKIAPRLVDEEYSYERYKLIKTNQKDLHDPARLVDTAPYNKKSYIDDYFRYRTFEFVAEEILEAGVQGALAEFGVFRGAFSSLISQKFSRRRIYLFDTFEGFDEGEAKKEIASGHCDEAFVQGHKDTSEERMMEFMPYKEECIICKGLFPQSISKEAEEETFAFVSIDVDFEESIYQGLCFFYPRLSEGGVIFVHDYNSLQLRGVKKAVIRYEQDQGIKLKKVPLADRAGNLVICK